MREGFDNNRTEDLGKETKFNALRNWFIKGYLICHGMWCLVGEKAVSKAQSFYDYLVVSFMLRPYFF